MEIVIVVLLAIVSFGMLTNKSINITVTHVQKTEGLPMSQTVDKPEDMFNPDNVIRAIQNAMEVNNNDTND